MSEDKNDHASTTPPTLVPPPVRKPETEDQAPASREPSRVPEAAGPSESSETDASAVSARGERAAVPFGSDRPVTAEPPALQEPDAHRGSSEHPAAVPARPEPAETAEPARAEPAEPVEPARQEPSAARPEPARGEPAHAETARFAPRSDAPTTAEPVTVAHPQTSPAAPPEPIFVPAATPAQNSGQESGPAPADPPQRSFPVAPVEPKKKGNRGIGSLIAVVSVVLFAVLYAAAAAAIITLNAPGQSVLGTLTRFFGDPVFYLPAILYVVGFVLVVLIVNRANWWSFVLGSLFVGLLVYLGSIGGALLGENVLAMTPAEASTQFAAFAVNPFVIAAALIAREVSLWTGGLISSRGRRMKARNLAARKDYERASAEYRAEYERGYIPTA